MVYIYGLHEPHGKIFYVGKTVDLKRRLRDHCRRLRPRGYAVLVMRILQTCGDDDWEAAERAEIAQRSGLINVQPGGVVCVGPSVAYRRMVRMAALGRRIALLESWQARGLATSVCKRLKMANKLLALRRELAAYEDDSLRRVQEAM